MGWLNRLFGDSTNSEDSSKNVKEEAQSLTCKAMVELEDTHYNQAEPRLKRALAIKEKAFGPDHPDVADSLDWLAILCFARKEDTQAETLLQRAHVIREKAYGPGCHIFPGMTRLAPRYIEGKKYTMAESILKCVLKYQENSLGPDNLEVAETLAWMGVVYAAKKEFAQSEQSYKRALKIREKALGPNHPDVATTLTILKGLSLAQGKPVQTETVVQTNRENITKNRSAARSGAVCDVCGCTIESGTLYSSDEIRKAAKKGFLPPKVVGNTFRSTLEAALGLPAGQLDRDWLARVASDTGDWALCGNCGTTLDEHLS
jgi:tetratricopeptide (TPR) repeat protein